MIEKEELIDYWIKSGIVKNKSIIKAFRDVSREDFISGELVGQAYGDYPLPIKCDQTISQPTTIVIMLEALELKKTDKVLEIGTGSGYNAALISKLAEFVYTTEFFEELADFAQENIEKAGIKNIEIIHTDGSMGYSKEAPYDKIIATAGCPSIPEPWIEQLKEGGIIVAPVGKWYGQRMLKIKKIKGKLKEENLGSFMFVPLRGKYGV